MDRTREQLILLIALLFFYIAFPVLSFIFAAVSFRNNDIENDILAAALVTLSQNPSAYTGILHQMVVPVVAAVTAANFAKLKTDLFLSRWLFFLPLVGIFMCLVDAVLFNIYRVTGTGANGEVATLPQTTPGVVGQLFLGMASTLATYVMLLVGLQAADK